MSQISEKCIADDDTIKMRPSGEIYVNVAKALKLVDTATGTTYNITIENGVITPVEV